MTLSLAALAAATACALSLPLAAAHPEYVAMSPNGANVPGVAAIGHLDANGGGLLNGYGLAFLLAGSSNTSWAALCPQDSDLDGQSNGWELGDPCCTWSVAAGKPPMFTANISNPGDLLSKTSRPMYNCTQAAGEEGVGAGAAPHLRGAAAAQ